MIEEFKNTIACYGEYGRQLYALHLDCIADLPSQLDLKSRNFVCFLAMDATERTDREVLDLAHGLTALGLSYICAWGPDCERVHDLFDSIEVEKEAESGIPSEFTLMSTWHDKESIQEALWFAASTAIPDENFIDSTNSLLAISVGNEQWKHEIHDYLVAPHVPG